MTRKSPLIACWCLVLGTAAFADPGPVSTPSPKVDFGISYELIISNNSDLIALAGPNSSIGAPADYAVGGWKFDLGYDVAPDVQAGLGFKTLNGKSLSFSNGAGKDEILNSNALGVVAEGRRIFRLGDGLEFSLSADAGYYWLIDSSLAATTGGGGDLSASAFGLFLGAGAKFYFDKDDNLGMGLDCGYQFLTFSPVGTPTGNLQNFDGSQASLNLSGFTILIDCVEVSFDPAPQKDKALQAPPAGDNPAATPSR